MGFNAAHLGLSAPHPTTEYPRRHVTKPKRTCAPTLNIGKVQSTTASPGIPYPLFASYFPGVFCELLYLQEYNTHQPLKTTSTRRSSHAVFRRPETFSFVLELLYPFSFFLLFYSSSCLGLSFFLFSFILARHASGVAGIVGQGEHSCRTWVFMSLLAGECTRARRCLSLVERADIVFSLRST